MEEIGQSVQRRSNVTIIPAYEIVAADSDSDSDSDDLQLRLQVSNKSKKKERNPAMRV